MTLDEMEALFHETDDEYLKFDRVENKRSTRPDLHAFILLNELVPGTRDIIAAAEHDEFFLDISADLLASVVTPEQVIELIRCGVRYSDDSLCMFA